MWPTSRQDFDVRLIRGRISLIRFDFPKLNTPRNCVTLSLDFSISFCLYLDIFCSGFGVLSEGVVIDDDTAR